MKNIFNKNTILSLSAASIIFTACRSADSDNLINEGGVKGTTILKVNLLGTQFSELVNTAQAMAGKNAINNNFSNIQKHSVLLTPSSVLTADLYDQTNTFKNLSKASTNISPVAGVTYPERNPLGQGNTFRVIAYEMNGTYITHQDYTIGGEATPFILKTPGKYRVISYSYGKTTLPSITTGELSNLNSAQLNYDNYENPDFMYNSQVLDIGNDTNYNLDIILMHKVAQITTTINAGALGNIIGTSNTRFSPNYYNGTIPLSSGNITNRTSPWGGVSNWESGGNSSILVFKPVFINADTSNTKIGSFETYVNIGGVTKLISLKNAFDILPGRKYFLNVNLTKRCGAYIAPGVWKDFMCHNLGADTTADPFTASSSIFGAKYQWGRYNPAISQATDISNTSYIPGWNSAPAPNTSWSDAVKTVNDPCPNGYRLPTYTEWRGVLANNTITRTGDWSGMSSGNAIKVGDNLLLPATGYRTPGDGSLSPRYDGYYWSSTFAGSVYGGVLYFNQSIQAINDTDMPRGINIRCIAQ
ncbi:TPA: hypothetical protein NEG48_000354 [Elizabethkingia anophelis]|nr:hypothetical protein [Elizabethkingia anophelis]